MALGRGCALVSLSVLSFRLPQTLKLTLDVVVADHFGLGGDVKPADLLELDLRTHLDGDRKAKRLAFMATRLPLNLGRRHRLQRLLLNRLAVGALDDHLRDLVHHLALDLLLDPPDRHLPWTEPR